MASQDEESLVTPTSLALSLAPPRAPPHGTAHRMLLVARDPSDANASHSASSDGGADAHSSYEHHGLRSRIEQIIDAAHLETVPGSGKGGGFVGLSRLPHPHLPAGPEIADRMTRALGATLPLPWQHSFRDSGGFRSLADFLVTASVPALALGNIQTSRNFLELTERRTEVRYGRHEMQKIDLFEPSVEDAGTGTGTTGSPRLRGLVFFIHGGAWGSGKAWMYRLVALPFLKVGMAVAIVGYRTYPDADVPGQVEDVRRAAKELKIKRPDLWIRASEGGCSRDRDELIGTCLMGHSSGAHIALLYLVDLVTRNIECSRISETKGSADAMGPKSNRPDPSVPAFDAYIGLSGPYDISHHFDYEAGRGVEELSPMKPSCGHTRDLFQANSPAIRLQRLLPDFKECDDDKSPSLGCLIPRMLLVHGIEDATVPFTATSEAARILKSCGVRSCDEMYFAKTGHEDVVMHFMLGGRAADEVLRWLELSVSMSRTTVINQSSL
mmetsp:Transcript_63359/g.187226  ORF Transcript_63359/g.187226 Transcript_63359/m.187226 type:complete len:497 (-) Transcript_63359:389-1879(-)|eukprot:CAMPEP_0113554002 /NCGR_PEP_ID=MMETSP0015_2-20120614/15913_1 /TAXON_ID=2838 /ORGANISM="Odontella" /LENGTH=496 /DNA_ID=CAMNT_0000455107 /DNA_START=131 /DNA_END=1621 /DNA_ORIENTATION=+ /assembly_acc=CAM_ASM_000160